MLGEALSGVRRESIEVMTKAFFPTGTGKNDRGVSRKHLMESINGSLRRLQMDYVDVYQAHRYDYETPSPRRYSARHLGDRLGPGKPTGLRRHRRSLPAGPAGDAVVVLRRTVTGVRGRFLPRIPCCFFPFARYTGLIMSGGHSKATTLSGRPRCPGR